MTAFRASYADWKVIKTRACVQVVLEIPIEQADAAYQVLGGMPLASKEVWCGVARLTAPDADSRPNRDLGKGDARNPGGDHALSGQDTHSFESRVPRSASTPPTEGDKPKKSPAQIAGYLCTQIAFQKFLKQNFGSVWQICMEDVADTSEDWGRDAAAKTVRHLCNVTSRAQIAPDNGDWSALLLAYKLWQNHPELEDA